MRKPAKTGTIVRDGRASINDAKCTFDEALRERVRFLVDRRSVREIARLTDTPAASVSDYLRGTRIPARFCAELVDRLGVNPAWLLTGKGDPFLADVAASAAGTTANLLELVQAVNVVMKQKLGSLLGDAHRMKMRELSEALAIYGDLRARLNEQFRPYYRKLLDDFNEAIARLDISGARSLQSAIEQVDAMCDDAALRHRFREALAWFENRQNNDQVARDLLREVVWHQVAEPWEGDISGKLNAAVNFAVHLHRTGCTDEAQRVYKAFLALAEPFKNAPMYPMLEFSAAVIDLYLGDARDALGRLTTLYPRVPLDVRPSCLSPLLEARLLTGAQTVAAAADDGKEALRQVSEFPAQHRPAVLRARALAIFRYANFLEDADVLRRAYRALWSQATHLSQRENLMPLHVATQLLLHALEKHDGRVCEEFKENETVRRMLDVPDPTRRFGKHVMSCKLARIVGRNADAMRALDEADDVLTGASPHITLEILLCAEHYRNVLRLIPVGAKTGRKRDMRVRAQTFFNDKVERGCMFFAEHAKNKA